MEFKGFIGGSYEATAFTADCARTVNWYPEKLQDPAATNANVLYPTPGVLALSTTVPGGGRGHFAQDGREFAVIGDHLYEVYENGSTLQIDVAGGGEGSTGGMAIDEFPATISSNGDGGNQLLVTSGRYAYYLDLGTLTFTQIAALDNKASQGEYLDGRFIVLDSNTSTIYVSELYDAATWNTGTMFAQRSLASDNWRGMKVFGRYLWLFGEYTTEIWQDTGANFPLAPFPATLIPYGIAAPFSAVVLGEDILWLGNTKAGRVCVLRSSGTAPTVCSTYPMESAIHEYPHLLYAVADGYSERGHSFYILGFDVAGHTWAWDKETEVWCERGTWRSALSDWTSWRPRHYVWAFDQIRTLDISGGIIYRLSSDYTTDVDGLPIRRMRRAPALGSENRRLFFSSLELDLEPGLGTAGEAVNSSLRSGLLNYWKLDEASGSRGQVAGVVALSPTNNPGSAAGISGDALQLVAASSQELTASVSSLSAAATGSETISIWFNPATNASGGLLLRDVTATITDSYRINQNAATGLVNCVMWGEDGGNATAIPLNPWVVGQWNHLVMWYDSSTKLVWARLNGGTPAHGGPEVNFPLQTAAGTLYVGHTAIGYYNGLIAHIGIWNRALSETEQDMLYWGGLGMFYPFEITGGDGYDPQVMLRMSNDGGKSWGAEQMRSAGKRGHYLQRVRWNRLGAARRRVFEVSTSDSVPWRLTGCYLETAAAERP